MSEHLDTKSVVEVISSLESHATTIVVKWRPFGRSNSRRMMGWIPPIPLLNSRDPVRLGGAEGAVHRPSLGSGLMKRNVRSLRRGKEQIRAKISESGRAMKVLRRDLRTGDNRAMGRGGPFHRATGRRSRASAQHYKRRRMYPDVRL